MVKYKVSKPHITIYMTIRSPINLGYKADLVISLLEL